ncbi:sigma-70 family RNA polymerase sigma factor [Pseudonocardia sp.]|uniref:RNA polymerase sigma factor n=1 Tax=Pseudonocardia sp. TaxID=60912 RepID=UPI00262822B6|nr:sigma-70 family RNA polymerase sigma factor [Pseudonocardia sp.]
MVGQRDVLITARDRTDTAARLREVEPMVRAICRGRLGEVDGDDAAQRALLGIWRALESDREIESVWGYAAATARYEVLNSYQDFARRPTPTDVTEATWVAANEPGPAEQVERRDETAHARERVEALLAQLSPRQAEVMRASVLADRGTADAAVELGITPTGVRAAQVRAMAQMRELCGVRSPNPQALNLTSAERGKRAWEAEKARRADRDAAAVPADADSDDDPLAHARAAVDALHERHGSAAPVVDDVAPDPMDRARAAVDALHEAIGDGLAEVDRPRDVVEDGADSIVADEVDANERTADTAGAA